MDNDVATALLLPEEFLPQCVRSTKDIYDNRSALKRLLLDDYTINYLLEIILAAVDSGRRLRVLECLKVIRAILRNNPFAMELDSQTVSKLFSLFKTFVFHPSEDVRGCANSLVLMQRLNAEEVAWLVANWDRSDHILNRLLRYPVKHSLISAWAKEEYLQGELWRRRSELIGLVIEDSIPSFVSEEEDTIVWALYYARIPDEDKRRLLMERFSLQALHCLCEVSVRLRYRDVIESMREKTRGSLQNSKPS